MGYAAREIAEIGIFTRIGRLSVGEQIFCHRTIWRISPHEKRELGKTVGMIESFRIPKLPDWEGVCAAYP
jgi:hypothetical protein